MCAKTENEILQMKLFVKLYYSPLLNSIDHMRLEEGYVEKIESQESKVASAAHKRELSEPKAPNCCSKVAKRRLESTASVEEYPILNRY